MPRQIDGLHASIDKVFGQQEEHNAAVAAAAEAAAPDNEDGADTGVNPAAEAHPDADKTAKAKAERGEDGKFKPKEKAEADEKAAKDAKAAKEPKDPKAAATGTQDSQTTEAPAEGSNVPAPASWSAEEKAQFAKFPPEAQRAVARREAERDKALRVSQDETAQVRQRYGDFDRAATAHTQRLAVKGETPTAAAARLLAIDAAFDADPAGTLKELARQRGINLSTLGNQNATAEADPFADPAAAKANERVSALEQQIENDKRTRAQAEYRQNESIVNNFADEKDAQGNLKRPFYHEVEADVADHIKRIRGANPYLPANECLQQAYETAVWANPRTRESLLALRTSATATSSAQAEKDRAAKAKAAAPGVRGSAAGTPTRQPSGKPDIRKMLDQALS